MVGRVGDHEGFIEIDAAPLAAVLFPALAASLFNEYPPHGLGRRREEVPAAVPALDVLCVYQPQIRLVDEGRRLEGLARFLLSQPLRRQLPQLIVNQRQ